MKLPLHIQDKDALRTHARSVRRALSVQETKNARKALGAQLTTIRAFMEAGTIACYVPWDNEISCYDALARGCAHTPRCYGLPRTEGAGCMTFRAYDTIAQLETAGRTRGIFQPPASAPVLAPAAIDIMLVPGLAFDVSGNRLGSGKGYYDRYLAAADAANIVTIGLTYDELLFDTIFHEDHDIAMRYVVSPSRIIG